MKNPVLIEEFLALVKAGKIGAVSAMIKMLADFRKHGRESRYLRKMTGFSIAELKTQSRGGSKGGSRVYLFFTEDDDAAVVNCEVKDGDSPDPAKIKPF